MAIPSDRVGPSTPAVLFVFGGAIAALYFAREIAIPFALALLLSFMLTPLVARLRRWGLPRVPSVIGVVAFSFAVLGSAGYLIAGQLSALGDELPQYQRNLQKKIKALRFEEGGTLAKIGKMTHELQADIAAETKQPATSPQISSGQARPIPVETYKPEPTAAEALRDNLAALAGTLGTAGVVVIFVFYMLLNREDLRERVLRLAGPGQLHATAEALDDAGQRVSRYLVRQLLINTGYGVPIAIGLYFIGVPYAVLWGCLAIVLRFIPYLGPIIAAVLPIGLAFAVDPDWSIALYAIALFLTLELITNNLIEPWLYGTTTGISPLAILVAAVFWTWLWGLAGLFLSTPLTVCLVVLGRHVPYLEFLDVLLGDQPVLPPGARFYQRMVVNDHESAEQYAAQFLEENSLETLFDEMIVPALSLAEQSRQRGQLSEAQEKYLLRNTRELIESLIDRESKKERDSGDKGFDAESEASPVLRSVLCVPAEDEADELIAHMLCHLLERRDIVARVVASEAIETRKVAAAARKAVEIFCVSALPPNALLRARAVTRRLRAKFSRKKIIVGLWKVDLEDEKLRKRLSVLNADHIVATLAEAANQITLLSTPVL
ncbi:MAG: AI-2E family transporter, partial [Gammaproteobacteria bacterium]